MKREISCNIVQDLLPNYIEKLTSNESNQEIEHHMDVCEDCKKVYEQMNSEMSSTVKVPVIEIKFLKKINRTRKLAALLAIILALILSYMLYEAEFKYTNDKGVLAAGITDFLPEHSITPYTLEIKEKDDTLIATFKDQTRSNVNGVAIFAKGLNQKYRIISTKLDTSDYSSVIQIFPIEIKNEHYYVISGYNLSDKIRYYGLNYDTYTTSGDLLNDRVKASIKFDVKNQQFLEVYRAEHIEKLLEESNQDILYNPQLISSSMYDINSAEITENFKIQKDTGNSIIADTAKDHLDMIYMSMWIVMELGIILMIFFLTSC